MREWSSHGFAFWWCLAATWVDLALQRHKLKGVWSRGGKCLGNCVPCCVARGFLRKNASRRSTPRLLQASCGVRIPGFRRQKLSSSYHFKKTGGFVACWVGGNPKTFCGWKRYAHALRCRQNLPSLWHRALAGCVWLGWTRGSERRLPSWTCCNSVAWCEMVGNHEKYRGWFS